MRRYPHVTVMLSLPRSRSAWMCAFVRAGVAHAWHDPLRCCGHVEDLARRIDAAAPGRVFIADTGAVLFFEQLQARLPGARFFAVVRDAGEVIGALQRVGIGNAYDTVRQARVLDRVLREHPGIALRRFAELNDPAVLAACYRDITGRPVDPGHVARMRRRNVQIDVAARRRQMAADPRLAALLRSADWRAGPRELKRTA